MDMIVIGYTRDGSIEAIFEGVRMMVPDQQGNLYRREIAEWERRGNIIPPYVEPAVSIGNAPVLEAYQFHAMLEIEGQQQKVDAYINRMLGDDKIVALQKMAHQNDFAIAETFVEDIRIELTVSNDDWLAQWNTAERL